MTTTPAPPTDHDDDQPPSDAGAARMLISAALWARPEAIADVAALVAPGDLNTTPQWRIWKTIVDRARAGLAGTEIVLDELIRTGQATPTVRAELAAAATAGAYPEALNAYAAPVTAAAFRRAVESHGAALVEAHGTASEAELWQMVLNGGRKLRGIVERLTATRGGQL